MYRLETTGLTLYTIDWLKVSISLGLYLFRLLLPIHVVSYQLSFSLILSTSQYRLRSKRILSLGWASQWMSSSVLFVLYPSEGKRGCEENSSQVSSRVIYPSRPTSSSNFVLCTSINKQTLSFHSIFRSFSFLSVCLSVFFTSISPHIPFD